jgi:hypothetical protein
MLFFRHSAKGYVFRGQDQPTVTTFRVSAAVMAVCAVVVWILAAASQEIGPRDAPPPIDFGHLTRRRSAALPRDRHVSERSCQLS